MIRFLSFKMAGLLILTRKIIQILIYFAYLLLLSNRLIFKMIRILNKSKFAENPF